MRTLSLMPFLVAMFAAVAAMPTNVYQICAWNAGTLEIEPWRTRASRSVRSATQGIRAWLASLWSPRLAFACLAVLLALMVASQGIGHEGMFLAVGTVSAPVRAGLESMRARLLKEAEAFKGANGKFADDNARQEFDTRMAEVEAIDASLGGQSATIVERTGLEAPRMTIADPPTEPNEIDRGKTMERERINGIMNACRAARLPVTFQDKLIAEGVSLVDAQSRVFQELAARDVDIPRQNSTRSAEISGAGPDPLVHVRAGIENAILHRVAPSLFKLEDVGREYRGMTMLDIAKAYLNARNIRTTGMSKMDVAARALGLNTRGAVAYHTTSDFSDLLADVANKVLLKSYDEAPQTFRLISRQVTLPDFKPSRLLQMGDAPALLEVKEHGEFTRGSMGASKETFALKTYGRVFAVTRQALVNDDVDAFSRTSTMFGRSARNLESDLVWEQITSNPIMGDGNALFSVAHGNLAADGDAIAIASLSRARTAMRLQTGQNAETLLNLTPLYLVVPPSLETVAEQYVGQVTPQTAGNLNPFTGKLTVVVDPRLEAISSTAWFLVASPDQIDVVIYAYLEGESGPTIETRVGFDVDGLEIKARHDFAAKAGDWRGIYMDPGEDVS